MAIIGNIPYFQTNPSVSCWLSHWKKSGFFAGCNAEVASGRCGKRAGPAKPQGAKETLPHQRLAATLISWDIQSHWFDPILGSTSFEYFGVPPPACLLKKAFQNLTVKVVGQRPEHCPSGKILARQNHKRVFPSLSWILSTTIFSDARRLTVHLPALSLTSAVRKRHDV